MKEMKNEIREWWGRVVRVLVVGVLLLSARVWAGYKPVDISDIQGERRERLTQVAKAIADFPGPVRDAFICEQLGLCFKKDGSVAMTVGPAGDICTLGGDAWYVTGNGKACRWGKRLERTDRISPEMWHRVYRLWWSSFPRDKLLSFYSEDVEKIAINTAKYLLRKMPKEHRWITLALMGKMTYDSQGNFRDGRGNAGLENGIPFRLPENEGRGCNFMDPEGRERDIEALWAADNTDWRWRHIVWRCENLVGSKDILELFPEEVEAMRTHYKERTAKVKDEAKAKNDALLVAADGAMSSLPKEKRLARIALAMGLYYLDHSHAGCTGGHLKPNATFILPDGTKHSGEEFIGEAPGLLQQVPHESILKFYRQPIEQMARKIAEARFKEMPSMLRDLLRAQFSRKLIKFDGTPAKMKGDHWHYETFDREWDLRPRWAAEPENAWFIDSKGNKRSLNIFKAYVKEYVHTIGLVCLCARILGKEETVELIPPGNVETKLNDTAPDSTDSATAETVSIPSDQTALGNTSRERVATRQDRLPIKGRNALREMPAEQRYAWLAEKMCFCFTEDGTPAYQSERTANADAMYVDAQGNVRKLSEVPGKDSAGWADATKTALAVGYDKFTAPYEEELKQLALQTSKHILASMPPGLRQSWLAEHNKFFFTPNAQVSRHWENSTLKSGLRISRQVVDDYRKCLYYDPSGKIVSATAVEEVWRRNPYLLFHCKIVVGIDAINAQFSAEVEAMRAHYKERMAKVKAENDALLVTADEAMNSLPKEKRLARIALAMGLYYLDHGNSGCEDGYLNPKTTIILPDGSKHRGEEFIGEAPGLLQQVPHEAILEFYRQPIEQMARAVAKERFGEMLPVLRDLERALLARELIKSDGSPAEIREGVSTILTFDRTWRVPMDDVDHQKTYFKNSQGQSISYRIFETYLNYQQTFKLVNLCARILGKEETVKLIPPGDEANMTAEQ